MFQGRVQKLILKLLHLFRQEEISLEEKVLTYDHREQAILHYQRKKTYPETKKLNTKELRQKLKEKAYVCTKMSLFSSRDLAAAEAKTVFPEP